MSPVLHTCCIGAQLCERVIASKSGIKLQGRWVELSCCKSTREWCFYTAEFECVAFLCPNPDPKNLFFLFVFFAMYQREIEAYRDRVDKEESLSRKLRGDLAEVEGRAGQEKVMHLCYDHDILKSARRQRETFLQQKALQYPCTCRMSTLLCSMARDATTYDARSTSAVHFVAQSLHPPVSRHL